MRFLQHLAVGRMGQALCIHLSLDMLEVGCVPAFLVGVLIPEARNIRIMGKHAFQLPVQRFCGSFERNGILEKLADRFGGFHSHCLRVGTLMRAI
jgi:hypothetical protein